MKDFPEKLDVKLSQRQGLNALRKLIVQDGLIDFASNDYLGFSKSPELYNKATILLKQYGEVSNSATGSRLLTGNNQLFVDTETFIATFHKAESALIFNSGYDANIGFFSCVPQRSDIILFDEYIHASIRDGIGMSHAKAYKFKHNDLEDLKKCINRISRKDSDGEIYIVTESVFSMDGDSPNLKPLSILCADLGCRLVIDEAHAIGVTNAGMVPLLRIETAVFARIVTFGKALGCHGAAILCSEKLKSYLINYARPLIYSTALPPHSVAAIKAAYNWLVSETGNARKSTLHSNIAILRNIISEKGMDDYFITSNSAIHCCIIPGNERVKKFSVSLMEHGYNVKPIVSPTVPEGRERLRICLHSFNTEDEIRKMVELLATFVQ